LGAVKVIAKVETGWFGWRYSAAGSSGYGADLSGALPANPERNVSGGWFQILPEEVKQKAGTGS